MHAYMLPRRAVQLREVPCVLQSYPVVGRIRPKIHKNACIVSVARDSSTSFVRCRRQHTMVRVHMHRGVRRDTIGRVAFLLVHTTS